MSITIAYCTVHDELVLNCAITYLAISRIPSLYIRVRSESGITAAALVLRANDSSSSFFRSNRSAGVNKLTTIDFLGGSLEITAGDPPPRTLARRPKCNRHPRNAVIDVMSQLERANAELEREDRALLSEYVNRISDVSSDERERMIKIETFNIVVNFWIWTFFRFGSRPDCVRGKWLFCGACRILCCF